MTLATHRGGLTIVATFLVAYLLTVVPFPAWAQDLRPQWTALVLIYWCLALPQRVGIFSGWFAGLGLDVLTGTVLGQHAMGLAIVAYLALKLHQRLRVFPLWQQAVITLALLMVERLLSFWIMGVIHSPPLSLWYWFPPLAGMLLWPWIFVLLREVRRHFRVS